MKKLVITAAAIAVAALSYGADPGKLVILHTNDTHSQIDPADNGKGGILRRKVLVDSVRSVERNVMLIDAGDALQGTLYYTLFGGEVERKMMDALGYDIQILGNHEFDNGMEKLARQWRQSHAEFISTNYDLTDTPLAEIVKPYAIREIEGKKIGFIAINLIPEGMIAASNSKGVKYLDGLKAANATAWHLKHNEKADMVIAITHIGYKSNAPGITDRDLAAGSENIDIIIGGHSHTLIDPSNPDTPPSRLANAIGDTILVVQAGKLGMHLGEITIDLKEGKATEKIISVDSRLDSKIDPVAAAIVKPYRHGVDSLKAIKIGYASGAFDQGEPALANMMSDIIRDRGEKLSGYKAEMAIMNRGGLRCGIPAGPITKGNIMQMMPFDNRITILEIKGSDLLETFDIMGRRGGEGVSSEVSATMTDNGCSSVTIDGEPIDPSRNYTIATIDYLADGGDYLSPLKRAKRLYTSDKVVYSDVIDHLSTGSLKGKKLKPDSRKRMKIE